MDESEKTGVFFAFFGFFFFLGAVRNSRSPPLPPGEYLRF